MSSRKKSRWARALNRNFIGRFLRIHSERKFPHGHTLFEFEYVPVKVICAAHDDKGGDR